MENWTTFDGVGSTRVVVGGGVVVTMLLLLNRVEALVVEELPLDNKSVSW